MQDKKVVVIGGGAGTDIALAGLKRYTSRLTALVSTFDASARGHAPHIEDRGKDSTPDDVHSSLLALGADSFTTQIMKSLFAYKLAQPTEREGNTFGSLLLLALTDITGAADLALQAAASVLNVQGLVLPLTLQPCPVVAHLGDGSEVLVHTPADLIAASAGVGLGYINLSQRAVALTAALQSIRNADIIVLGPADFHFNLLAPLQIDEVAEAIAESNAVKIFVCNILTQPHTTDGWPASRFIRVMLDSLGGPGSLDYVIVNSTSLALDALTVKAAKGYFPVRLDLEECLSTGLNIIVRPVAAPATLRHDAEKLVRTILFLGGARVARRPEKQGFFAAQRLEAMEAATNLAHGEAVS